MHMIEPFFSWRQYYIASEDPRSPFFGRAYSETELTHAIYNYLIHPQWDLFGSNTLVAKVLYVNYEQEYTVIELMGEWNDVLYNDIMYLKSNLMDPMYKNGVKRFVLIGENVLNFHGAEDDYYQEWYEDIRDAGYIFMLCFQPHVITEFLETGLDQYLCIPSKENEIVNWRIFEPLQLKKIIEKYYLLLSPV
ncbi:MAG: hypothetical protein R6U19_05750 [Bacteroidales bacterium]